MYNTPINFKEINCVPDRFNEDNTDSVTVVGLNSQPLWQIQQYSGIFETKIPNHSDFTIKSLYTILSPIDYIS